MHGPRTIVATISAARLEDKVGNVWQYLSRGDHHSKIACWAIVFDLLLSCPLLRRHVEHGKMRFGINHEMRDFRQNKKKKLDLVLCTPRTEGLARKPQSLGSMARKYDVVLTSDAEADLAGLPALEEGPVASVLLALEAKACMTAHQRALPRLYDELNSSHQTVHGNSEHAIAAGFVMINAAERYLSPDLNKPRREIETTWSTHVQPRDASLVVERVHQLPRRSGTNEIGYDALAILIIKCANDGSPVGLVEAEPAPKPGEIHYYESMIDRLANQYASRFKGL